MQELTTLITVAAIMGGVFILISSLSYLYSLRQIKNKTAGNGQHGTARWASSREIHKTYKVVPFEPKTWRRDEKRRPTEQGIIVGCESRGNETLALVDSGDVHCMMIGAAGVGKTAFWLYPNIEHACATGMSFMTTDTKGDIMRNYGSIAEKYYGYRISVIDLRNPMRSHGNNLLHLVNKYMDLCAETNEVQYKAKAEKYAKIISKTIISPAWRAVTSGRMPTSMMPRRTSDSVHSAGVRILQARRAAYRFGFQDHSGASRSRQGTQPQSVPTAHGKTSCRP